jgi:hypothetical protein
MLGQLPRVTETTPGPQKIYYWGMGFFWIIIITADFLLMMVLEVIFLNLLAVEALFGVVTIIVFIPVLVAFFAGIGYGVMHRDARPAETS